MVRIAPEGFFSDDHARMLRERGHRVGSIAGRAGTDIMLVEVDDVFMFDEDAIRLAEGRDTMEAIRERNRGKIFPHARP